MIGLNVVLALDYPSTKIIPQGISRNNTQIKHKDMNYGWGLPEQGPNASKSIKV